MYSCYSRHPLCCFHVGEMSSFVQEDVEVVVFDLQRQHGRDFTPLGHARYLVQGNSEMGTQAKRSMSGEGHLLPYSLTPQ